jgi:predicted secreted hydrolase
VRWLIMLVMVLAGCRAEEPRPDAFSIADLLGGTDTDGYARAREPRPFRFPDDHGVHPDYRNEWWYLTGQLQATDGREFGFQVTFFRTAVAPHGVDSRSAWRTRQVWMAHAALTDLAGRQHTGFERFARQAVGLAGASARPFRVWLEDWQLSADQTGKRWQLKLPTRAYTLNLDLSPLVPVVLQGEQGLSRKSGEAGNASYYYSIPRLAATGYLVRQGEALSVSGLAWLDREWSTSALGPDQVGWDWFSLQLRDGRNVMYYQLRDRNGRSDPYSSGSISDRRGPIARLDPARVELTPLRYWQDGQHRYPVEWRMRIPGEPHAWRVRTLLDDQLMRLSVRYWEGAVKVVEEDTEAPIGRGFLEMTGY